jgi:two-component system alkaline phosphatase synthesis response regulator PhoP
VQITRPSVLVCDDEPNLRELIRVSLGSGWVVHEATDGEEALTLARSLRPDLVILDLMMPRLNGLDVLSRLKADPRLTRTRVLVVTAQPASEGEAREHGADGVIVKPFAPEDLAELAATLVALT